ncbi:aromatase/cyclase [Nocardia terpenica]|uniref:Cyclase n=1 Tax=Nocardia terpenica TaxID=455432 RepID=A0A6G9YZ32_9NOCA|nr:aromatase/cyclase [Nocardia terpenica]QIS18462.1 cyclase [Nocardia terpenica]
MQTRHTEHVITVPDPADSVYNLIADAERWPVIFTPTVHVEYLSPSVGEEQRLRISAFAGRDVKSWVSHRSLSREKRRVSFRQTQPVAPVTSMRGEWKVIPVDEKSSKVIFSHWFTAEHDSKDILDTIEEIVDYNSRAELDSLHKASGRSHLVVDFEDEVRIGAEQAKIFEFLADAQKWPTLIPHVARVALTEDHGIQTLEMDTFNNADTTGESGAHTTSSVRVLLPPSRIAYKQTTLPPFLTAHVGSWDVREDGTAVAKHTIVLDEESILSMLGPQATVEKAAGIVRQSIGGNSMATLRRARELIGADQ